MVTDQVALGTPSEVRINTKPRKRLTETAVALAGTAFSAILLVETAVHAGPLWRDEVNTFNVAHMASLKELWANLQFESFPPLWPLIVRAWGSLGVTNSDLGTRLLGLCVGLLFLLSLWLCARWIGACAPTLSVALLGSLPAMIFLLGANRAYGLASSLLVVSFGMLWRMLERPSFSRVLGAAVACFLFAQCVYYDAILLCAILAGAGLVALRRRQWRAFYSLVAIGLVSGGSMAIYLPITDRTAAAVPMIREPFFHSSELLSGLSRALAFRSSAYPGGPSGPQIWLWAVLLLGGSALAVALQFGGRNQKLSGERAEIRISDIRADLALYCSVSALVAGAGLFVFLLRLGFFMQSWYFVEILALWAVAIDGMLGADWPALSPWGRMRIAFLIVVMALSAGSAWQEAHTRRSNVDLIASVLELKAAPGDLVVMQDAWEGITFDRYYHGPARWLTVPPIDSHKVHRTDLVMEEMSRRDPMSPVLREITDTLRDGHTVWLAGNMPVIRPKQLPSNPPPPPGLPTKWWLGAYLYYWNIQVSADLLDHAQQKQVERIPMKSSVSYFENLSLARFSGYRPAAE